MNFQAFSPLCKYAKGGGGGKEKGTSKSNKHFFPRAYGFSKIYKGKYAKAGKGGGVRREWNGEGERSKVHPEGRVGRYISRRRNHSSYMFFMNKHFWRTPGSEERKTVYLTPFPAVIHMTHVLYEIRRNSNSEILSLTFYTLSNISRKK